MYHWTISLDIQDSLDVLCEVLVTLKLRRSQFIFKNGLVLSHTRPPVGIHTVEGIAVDWMGQNLYWTDDGPEKTISVAKLEKASQTRKTLIEGKMTHPRAIVVDPAHG